MTRGPASNGQRTRRADAPAPDPSAEADLAALLRELARHVRELLETTSEFASLGWKRLKLRAADRLFSALFLLAALATGATILVAAALLVVAGIRHALARWAGAEWVGELGGGALALLLPFLALLLVRRWSRRSLLDHAIPPAKRTRAGHRRGAP